MPCLVACAKHGPNGESRYRMVCIEHGSRIRIIDAGSRVALKPGEVAEVELDRNGAVESAAILESKEAAKRSREILAAVGKLSKSAAKNRPYRKGIGELDELTRKMWPKLVQCSELLVRKLLLGAPVIVRFHNDADGSSGACSLSRGLGLLSKRLGIGGEGSISWIMHPGVSYGTFDSGYDTLIANGYSSMEKPLLIIIDFGTSADSNSGIRGLGGRFDIIWLDHHPIVGGFEGKELELYVNPWLYGGDSNYTAGFLASAFSRTFSSPENGALEDASFIGDYSEYSSPGKEGQEIATILDLLTSDTRIGSGSFSNKIAPHEIENILNDRKRAGELLSYANTRLNETLDLGLASLRKHRAGESEIYVLNFGRVRTDETKYPLPGRFASKLLDRVREVYGTGNVVVVHIGAYISVRIDKQLGDRVGILGLIEELKSRYGSIIDAGGGHKCAASVKLANKDAKGAVIKELVSMIKERLE